LRGDIIIVEEHHRNAAELIIQRLMKQISTKEGRFTMTVAGESGSGKSETALALAQTLEARGVSAAVLQQDDYFVHPPKTNDLTRRKDISWVGPQEVRLDLLDDHLKLALDGEGCIVKPLVLYAEDCIHEETLSIEGAKVVIAEGTYTTLLENVDVHVFIARNRLETMAHRRLRAREAPDPFIEDVLQIEHEIISENRERAHIIITRNYDVQFSP
jgi:uridine kinase